MIDMIVDMFLGVHNGRPAYVPTECKMYKKALHDKEYKMNDLGRHPFNIITEEIYD